ncbi:Nucleotidyltransferase [Hyaloscypha variabilis F]|uniref:DNA polymerase n=1 Tax=Hyaloscypha variabilis (strain UAMH 11265 / GT02V1 / F) TaxID=1149755 RepID=A0A2J6SCU6_HYAVF|nr:Nucleotidyltransferase [Hyaloscypha variabilis F]
MKNSTGIASMLGKKRKRKEQLIKLVPENDRIFAGKIFYYVPPDDNAPVRRLRITRARNYGATWTTEWIPSITHVVVDKGLTYSDVMTFLKPVIDADALPPNVILVNEDYPINCTQYMSLLDSKQTQYIVNGYGIELEKPAALKSNSPEPDNSLQVKPSKSKKWDDLPDKQTPPRSKSQSQRNLVHGETGSSPGLWLVPQERDEAELVQSSEQPAPLDIDSSKNSVGSADDTPFGSFSGLGGALKQAIEEARMYQHLPLDDDDDDNYRDRPSSSEGPEDSDDSERDRSPIRKPKRKKKGTANQANYSCMQGGTGIAVESNPNGVTISILEEMAEYYDRVKDHWRTTAYRRAIGTMKRQTRKIVSYDEAIVLPHIGHRIATKIEEIALTNRLRRLDHIKLEPNDLILQTFMKVYGAAADQASKWIKAGHKTLDDLRAHAKLTEKQQIGLDHYDDFNTRIPYRRGATSSGDIDFILTKPGTTSSNQLLPFLSELVHQLARDGFLVAALAEPRTGEGSKWHGACVLPGVTTWRRIDFLLVSENSRGAALIYFTGDDLFNRSMRLLAGKKHMRLNQRGLYENVIRGPGRVKYTEGTLVAGADEKEIFRILGVPWRPPEQRICH